MSNKEQSMNLISQIIADEQKGCVFCHSQDDLVYCDLGEDSLKLLCKDCREEYLFDDDGNLKVDEVNELFDSCDWEELAREEGEEISYGEQTFIKAILG